jgi:hypothetical protein
MNGMKKSLAATFLSAAMLFTSAAQAMPIWQFDKMAQDDRADYVSELIQGAEKVLTDEGKPDLAAQVSHLFTTNAPDSDLAPTYCSLEGSVVPNPSRVPAYVQLPSVMRDSQMETPMFSRMSRLGKCRRVLASTLKRTACSPFFNPACRLRQLAMVCWRADAESGRYSLIRLAPRATAQIASASLVPNCSTSSTSASIQ